MYCQARSIAQYHCRSRNKTEQETESRFRSAGYYGTEFRSRRVTTEDKRIQQPPLTSLHRMQCTSAAAWWQLVISYIYPPGGIIFTALFLLDSIAGKTHIIIWYHTPGLDIGYVPAGPDAFFRWSGQFGPQQLIFYWPAGPVDFFFFFFFFF